MWNVLSEMDAKWVAVVISVVSLFFSGTSAIYTVFRLHRLASLDDLVSFRNIAWLGAIPLLSETERIIAEREAHASAIRLCRIELGKLPKEKVSADGTGWNFVHLQNIMDCSVDLLITDVAEFRARHAELRKSTIENISTIDGKITSESAATFDQKGFANRTTGLVRYRVRRRKFARSLDPDAYIKAASLNH